MTHKNKKNPRHLKIFIYVEYIGLNKILNPENFKLHAWFTLLFSDVELNKFELSLILLGLLQAGASWVLPC